ncbi:MAG: FkbM family methyltransferase [Bacteroidia bacterium]|nr:FkbM family methyltransferase [Bacteroidia bacterium]
MKLNRYVARIFGRLKILDNHLFTMKREVHGRSWNLPILDRAGLDYAHDNSEKWIYEILRRIQQIKPIHTFLDVGVNNGQTLIKIKSLSSEVNYIGFEPNVNCVYYSSLLTELNQLTNVQISAIGLGDKNDWATFKAYAPTDARGTLVSDKISSQDAGLERKVPVFKLDDIGIDLNPDKLNILKIDVEGFELNVVQGAKDVIKKFEPVVLFEVLPYTNEVEKSTAQELYDTIVGLGYDVFQINTKTSDIAPVKTVVTKEITGEYDFIGIPNSQKSVYSSLQNS